MTQPKVELDTATLQRMSGLGDRGVAMVVIRPEHWSALREAATPVLEVLPKQAPALAKASLPDLLALLLRRPMGSVHLEGWDEGRPIVASVAEVPLEHESSVVAPRGLDREGRFLSRSVIELPASDPAALVSSLVSLARALGPEHSEPFDDGTRAFIGAGLSLALVPHKDAVRVVMLHGRTDAPHAAQALAEWPESERVDLSPSPALAQLLDPDVMAGVWLRPSRMRQQAVWTGLHRMQRALQAVNAFDRESVRAEGLRVVLDSERVMSTVGAEMDDLAATVMADGSTVRVRSAWSLTSEGVKAIDAARQGASPWFRGTADDAWASLAAHADVRAMLDAAEPLWQAVDPQRAVPFDRKRNIGLHHLALRVADVETLHQLYGQLAARGDVEVEFEPEPLGGKLRHMMCAVPGNIRLELVTNV